MQTLLGRRPASSSPLYVRWDPERSPYAIELKLEIVSMLAPQIEESKRLGTEIGGALVGAFPPAGVPTLRIESFELFERGGDNSPVFMLDPKEYARLGEVQARARRSGRSVVGFFRTHLRPGPLRPSLADRTLFGSDFKEGIEAILLIQGTEPHFASFFVGARGQLTDEPAVREFRFNAEEFGGLPEVEPAPAIPDQAEKPRARAGWYLLTVLLLLTVIATGLYIWSVWSGVSLFPSPSSGIALAVTGTRVLHITWNHSASEVARARSAKLVILDGTNRREVPIGLDELRLGTVEYQRAGEQVQVTLVLDMPDATSLSQSIAWHS